MGIGSEIKMRAVELCLLCVAALVLQTEASVTITSSHTQKYKVGDTVKITWSSTGISSFFYVSLAQSGTTFKMVTTSSKSYSYTITSSVYSDVTVTVQNYYDWSSTTVTLQMEGSFELYAPSPNATTSSPVLLRWDAMAYGPSSTITLKCYSSATSSLIQTITTSTLVSAKQYAWTAPSSVGMYYLVGSFSYDSWFSSDTTASFAVNSPNGAVTALYMTSPYQDSDSFISLSWGSIGLPPTAPVTFYIVHQQTGKAYQSSSTGYLVSSQSGSMSMPSSSYPSGQYKVRIQAAGVNQTSVASFTSAGSYSNDAVSLPTAAIAGISAGSFVVFIVIVAAVCACLRSGALAAACCCRNAAITSGPAPAKTTEIVVSYNNVGATGSPQMQLAMAPHSGPVGYPQPAYQPAYQPGYNAVQTPYRSTQTSAATNGDYAAYLQGGHRPTTAPVSTPTVMMAPNGYMVADPNMPQTMHQQPVYMTADGSHMSYMQTQQHPGGYVMYQQVPYGVQQVPYGVQQVPVEYASAPPPSYETGSVGPSV